MRSLMISILFGFASAVGASAETADSRVATMPFEECLSIIAEASQEVDEEPVKLVSTSDVTSVRINASDGHVTVSCSRSDNKMTLTKHPALETAGVAAAE